MNVEGTVLLVASTGGHLAQLARLAQRWGAVDDSVWVTFDAPQSRSMLRGRNVVFVPYVRPRSLTGTLRARAAIDRELEGTRFDAAVSTGAAIAVSAFTSKHLRRTPKYYVESVTRTEGPSLTGRIVSALRLAEVHTQHAGWATPRWKHVESVLEDFITRRRGCPMTEHEPRILVTLGTIAPYRFDSLVDAVLRSGMASDRTTWQLGSTVRSGLPGRSVVAMSHNELVDAAQRADIVVTHAGAGTLLELLEIGVCPVVVPRRKARGEHVDDHQALLADLLRGRELGVVREAEELSARDMLLASGMETRPVWVG